MRDDRDEFVDRLFRAGRARRVDFAPLEEHFETRLMAGIAERRETRGMWSAWAWRLVPWFAALLIMVGASGLILERGRSGDLFATFAGDDEFQVSSLFMGE